MSLHVYKNAQKIVNHIVTKFRTVEGAWVAGKKSLKCCKGLIAFCV